MQRERNPDVLMYEFLSNVVLFRVWIVNESAHVDVFFTKCHTMAVHRRNHSDVLKITFYHYYGEKMKIQNNFFHFTSAKEDIDLEDVDKTSIISSQKVIRTRNWWPFSSCCFTVTATRDFQLNPEWSISLYYCTLLTLRLINQSRYTVQCHSESIYP